MRQLSNSEFIYSLLNGKHIACRSLNICLNDKTIQKTRESTGNSGSFFFFSHDHRLILKTLTQAEMKTLLKHLLPAYFSYITTENKNSLLSRYYAAFRVDLK